MPFITSIELSTAYLKSIANLSGTDRSVDYAYPPECPPTGVGSTTAAGAAGASMGSTAEPAGLGSAFTLHLTPE